MVPAATWLSSWMLPPCCLTMPWTMASPRPVPLPGSFEVKNGSNACSRVKASMPQPVSETVSSTSGPGGASTATGSSRDADGATSICQRPALRHRILRVHGQVHQDLLELSDVGPHQARLRRDRTCSRTSSRSVPRSRLSIRLTTSRRSTP